MHSGQPVCRQRLEISVTEQKDRHYENVQNLSSVPIFCFLVVRKRRDVGLFSRKHKNTDSVQFVAVYKNDRAFFYGITLQVTGRYRPSLRKVQNLNGFVSMNSAVGDMVDKFFNL